MEKIIDPIDVNLIKAELTPDKKLCNTNKAGNEIYVVDCYDAPNVLKEIGRLREEAFRTTGACSGKSCDLDEFDFLEKPYKQIVIWDPDAEAILGGYRFILGPDVQIKEDGQPHLSTSHLFHFSEKFLDEYLPHVIELGRSFVTPAYQSSKAGAKGIFALDNLWDGIGAVMMQHPGIHYFFGKATLFLGWNKSCRDMLAYFMWKHFPDDEELVRPINPVSSMVPDDILGLIFDGEDFKSDYRKLKDSVRRLGCTLPPLVNSYINISPTTKMFGVAVNDELSDAEEVGILVCFNEMYADKRDRHKEPYLKNLLAKVAKRFPYLNDRQKAKIVERSEEKNIRLFQKFKQKIKK